MKLRNVALFAAATIALGGCGKAEPQIKMYARQGPAGVIISLHNNENQAVQLNRLILNGRQDDSACSVNLFRSLEAGARTEVTFPSCGEPLQIELQTDRGTVSGGQTSLQRDLDVTATDQPGSRATILRNQGRAALMVRKIVLNDQPDNPACNFQVGQPVAVSGELTVSTDTCGRITSIQVETDQGTTRTRVDWNRTASENAIQ